MPEPLAPLTALKLLLQHIDYEGAACDRNDLIGAVLPPTVLAQCKEAAQFCDCHSPMPTMEDRHRCVKCKLPFRDSS